MLLPFIGTFLRIYILWCVCSSVQILCIMSFRVNVPAWIRPYVCMSAPSVCPHPVMCMTPSCICSSVCMYFSVYILVCLCLLRGYIRSVCMSPPCVCPKRLYVPAVCMSPPFRISIQLLHVYVSPYFCLLCVCSLRIMYMSFRENVPPCVMCMFFREYVPPCVYPFACIAFCMYDNRCACYFVWKFLHLQVLPCVHFAVCPYVCVVYRSTSYQPVLAPIQILQVATCNTITSQTSNKLGSATNLKLI